MEPIGADVVVAALSSGSGMEAQSHRGGQAAPPGDASAGNTSPGDTSALALALAGDIDRALNDGHTDVLSEAAVQALMAVACRSYSAKIEAGASFLPLAERSRVASTDVMVTASGLLKAANLAVFELGMWQSWTGR